MSQKQAVGLGPRWPKRTVLIYLKDHDPILKAVRKLLQVIDFDWSGRRDLNPGPLAPQASALARLRHGPMS